MDSREDRLRALQRTLEGLDPAQWASFLDREFITRHRVGVAAGAAVVVALLGGLFVSSLLYLEARSARRRAEFQAYIASLAAADVHIVTAEAQRRQDLAEMAQSQLAGAPAELRNWEWRYLATKLDGSVATLWGASDPSSGTMRLPSLRGRGEEMNPPIYKGTLSYSPESRQVLWATAEGVHAWDMNTKRLTAAWAAFGTVFALSADGSKLLSTDWHRARPWRVIATRTGATLATLGLDSQGVQAAAFSPDGERLVTIDITGGLQVWSAATGESLSRAQLTGLTTFVRFGRDSDRVIASIGEALYDWSFLSEAEPRKVSGTSGAVFVAGAVANRGALVVADTKGAVRQLTAAGTERDIGQHPGVKSIAVANNSDIIATADNNGEIRLWDTRLPEAASGQSLFVLDAHGNEPIDALLFTPDDRFLVAGSNRGLLRVWDVATARLSMGATPVSTLLAVSANGRYALTSELLPPRELPVDLKRPEPLPRRVSRVDLESLESRPIELRRTDVGLAALSNDGSRLLFAGRDGAVGVWSSDDTPPVTVSEAGTVTVLAVDPDGKRFAAVWLGTTVSNQIDGERGRLRVWDESGRALLTLDQHLVRDIKFDATGDRLLVSPVPEFRESVTRCHAPIQLWDVTRRRLVTSIDECPSSVVFVDRGATIATQSLADGRIRTWNSRDGSLRSTSSETIQGYGLASTSDASRIAAATRDSIRIFDSATLTPLLTIDTPADVPIAGARSNAALLQFTSDGSRLIADTPFGLRFWEARRDYSPDARVVAHKLIGPRLVRFRSPAGVQLADEVIDEIRANQALDPQARLEAIEEVRNIGNWDLAALCTSSRTTATRADLTGDDYMRAVRMADVAVRFAPWSSYCVGVSALARYRAGDYAGALERLDAAMALRSQLLPGEIAIKAMALSRLGRDAEAASAAAALASQPEAVESTDEESSRLVKELDSLMAGRKSR